MKSFSTDKSMKQHHRNHDTHFALAKILIKKKDGKKIHPPASIRDLRICF